MKKFGKLKSITFLPEQIMNKETKFINHLHLSTKRNYLERVNNKKPIFMKNAKKYSFDYWDGSRKQGYGVINIFLEDGRKRLRNLLNIMI